MLFTNVSFINNRALSGGAVVLTAASSVLFQNVSLNYAVKIIFCTPVDT